MISQFKKNLFHVESSGESFDKNCRANRVVRHADIGLREHKYIVPETSFEIMFHFWKIEVWSGTTFDKLVSIVIEVQSKVKERA